MIAVLGGATIWFHNPTFIKWKPSALDWAMALALWLSQTLFGKNLLQALVGEQLVLPRLVWQRLNLAWIAFFTLMGIANLYVAYNFSTSVWATFKVFGLTGLMLAFMLAQGFYISRYLQGRRRHGARGRRHLAGGERRPGLAMSVSAADIETALRAALAPDRSPSSTTATCTPAMPARAKDATSASPSPAHASKAWPGRRHRLVYDALRLPDATRHPRPGDRRPRSAAALTPRAAGTAGLPPVSFPQHRSAGKARST